MKQTVLSLAALSMAVMPLTAQAHWITCKLQASRPFPVGYTPSDANANTFLADYSQWATRANYTEVQDKYRNCAERLILSRFRIAKIHGHPPQSINAEELLTECYYSIGSHRRRFPAISDDAYKLWSIYIHLNLPPFQGLAGEWEEFRPLIERAAEEHEAPERATREARRIAERALQKAEGEYVVGELERLMGAGLLKAE